MTAQRLSLLLALLSLLLLPVLLLSAATDKPQGHKGLVKPFKPGPPGIKLKSGEIEKLRKGEAVKRQLSSGSGGRGLVIQDVHAPPEVVWGRIMDFPAYTRMVPRVSLCENYKVQDNYMQGLKEIYTRMRLSVMGFNVEYFIHHKYYPKMNTVVWTLDYNRESDLDDSVGYWHVIPHPDPDREHWSRVYYSIDMRLKSWMPGFVKNVLKNQALTQATSWVKKESEKIGVPAKFRKRTMGAPQVGREGVKEGEREGKRGGILVSTARNDEELERGRREIGPPDMAKVSEGLREMKEGWCRRLKDATNCINKRMPWAGGKATPVVASGKGGK